MKLAFITALSGLAALLAAPTLAQPADAPPPPGGEAGPAPMGPPPGGMRGGGGGRERMLELREALKLRPDQESAFTTYVAALRPDPAMRDKMRAEREKMAALPADQRRAERQSDSDFEAMRAKRQEATRAFMAALTPEQQQQFETYRRDHRPGGGMGRGYGGQGGPGGPPPPG